MSRMAVELKRHLVVQILALYWYLVGTNLQVGILAVQLQIPARYEYKSA